jgi:hypothetical protein
MTEAAAPNIIDKSKVAVATATALMALFVPIGTALLPARHYPIAAVVSPGYEWEAQGSYSTACLEAFRISEETEIVQRFVTTLVERSQDLDPEYDRLIGENFWELV